MKLSPQHITRVEEVLAEQRLVFKDFENEMVDHICSVIENEYTEDADFEIALHNELYAFKDHFFEASTLYENGLYFTGIRALEMERFKEVDQSVKKAFFALAKSQFKTWRIFIWAVAYFVLFQIEKLFGIYLYGSQSIIPSFFIGMLIGYIMIRVPFLFGNTPIYRTESDSILKYFPTFHALLRPRSAQLHSLRKLCIVPFVLLALITSFNYFMPASFVGITTLLAFCITLSIYIIGRLYFAFKKSGSNYSNS